jgi:F-type H+-transporting ATPase subunit epsilon
MLLEIITPEKTVVRQEVDEVLAPTDKGQIGILPHHINLVTKLTQGELIMIKNGKENIYAVSGGFLQVNNGIISVLADYAAHADDIDIEKAIEAQKHAQDLLKKSRENNSEQDFAIAESELRKSLLQINVVKRRHPKHGAV